MPAGCKLLTTAFSGIALETIVNHRFRGLALLLSLFVGAAIGLPDASASDMLSGRVTLPDRVQTPANAVLEVALVDLSALDEDDHLLGSLRVDNPGPSPLRFSIPFDRKRIFSSHRYVVRAVLRVNSTVAYSGEDSLPAKGRFAAPVQFSLTATDAPAATPAPKPAPSLIGPEWRVVEIDGQPVAAGAGGHEPTLFFGEAQRVQGMAGCNRFSGHYDVTDGALHTDSLVTTRMACPPPAMTIEAHFLAALAAASTILQTGDALELGDGAGMVRLRLEGRPAH